MRKSQASPLHPCLFIVPRQEQFLFGAVIIQHLLEMSCVLRIKSSVELKIRCGLRKKRSTVLKSSGQRHVFAGIKRVMVLFFKSTCVRPGGLLRTNARAFPRKQSIGTNSSQLCQKVKVKLGEALFRRGDCCYRAISARFMQ